MIDNFTRQLATLDAAIKKSPSEEDLYAQRGHVQLFLAHFPEAVADFEKQIALDPTQDAPHWQLGIAYYFAGQYEKSSRQFAKYQTYESGDRENGIWKFLADVKVLGLEAARRAMIEYTRFDREPFPTLYAVFAGEKTGEQLFAEIREKNLADDGAVMFFANYYGGLNEELLGHRDNALALLRQAVASPWARRAQGGPSYMWQVARLHYETLAAK